MVVGERVHLVYSPPASPHYPTRIPAEGSVYQTTPTMSSVSIAHTLAFSLAETADKRLVFARVLSPLVADPGGG